METTGLYFENDLAHVTVQGSASALWTYTCKASTRAFPVAAPLFEVDGVVLSPELTPFKPLGQPERLANGSVEYRCEASFVKLPDLALELVFRIAADNPVVRFAYVLKSQKQHHLTKAKGHDALTYLGVSLVDLPQVKDIRFSEFVELFHSYHLSEHVVEPSDFKHGISLMGPLLTVADASHALLVGYEHGSQAPDAFLHYHLKPERQVTLSAVKGNYFQGQVIDAGHPYRTVWLQMAVIEGDESDLAHAYRDFMLRYQSLYNESRKPYIYYNTWNAQERNQWLHNHHVHDSIHQEHILQEIQAAARLGVEVFVINTGWYDRAGDWEVNKARFHDNLKSVKEQLASYGMKLGLWFAPATVAANSAAYTNYAQYEISWQGEAKHHHRIWEVEKHHTMCLVSPYGDYFADTLIHLAKEIGVTYFQLDAVHQYGCDDPKHLHGDHNNSNQERADSYAFQLVREVTHIAERICAAIPDAIVDLDVTEAERPFGLGFLSAGKYFVLNNGPYYQSYDIPPHAGQTVNSVFVHPGHARTWICRAPLVYDKWLPSTLLLTHYLADDPLDLQMVNLASLILGQNGIWGDLLNVSAEGMTFIYSLLERYRVLRDDITAASLLKTGELGGSPEIYEKIGVEGRGVIVVFSTAAGNYSYVTRHPVGATVWHTDDVKVTMGEDGYARIDMTFWQRGAKILLFDN